MARPTYQGNYNVSRYNGNDGGITTNVNGGAPPYTYLWSNGAATATVTGLTSATYTVTITDANLCSIQKTATLTQPPLLQVSSITSTLHNGYNVSCNNGNNGNITIAVTGGVTPYRYQWNNGSFSQNLTNLTAGTYNVIVRDTNNASAIAQITLTQPTVIAITATPSAYPDGYNVSCFHCYNGSITTSVSGGVSAYAYSWSGGQTTANLSTLGGGVYSLTVTDANSCTKQSTVTLTEQPSNDWTMAGNTGTDPATQFMGTTDNIDFVFRTNNQEKMRMKGTGNIGIGINDPQQQLHVGGTIRSNSLAFTSNNENDIKLLGTTRGGDIVISQVDLNPVPLITCEQPVLAWIHCTTDPDNIYKSPSLGNIGIGSYGDDAKLDPTVKLEITGKQWNAYVPNVLLKLTNAWTNEANVINEPTIQFSNFGDANNYWTIGGQVGQYFRLGYKTPATTEIEDFLKVDNVGNLIVPKGAIQGNRSQSGALFIEGNTNPSDGGDIELYSLNDPDRPSEVAIVGNKIVFASYSGGSYPHHMSINENGQISIGLETGDHIPNDEGYKLAVNGKIMTEGLRIQLSDNWPDYVFNKNYILMSILELKNYINKYQHLPEIPKASEIYVNGMDVKEINELMLKKIEELTLYVIHLEDEIIDLRQRTNK